MSYFQGSEMILAQLNSDPNLRNQIAAVAAMAPVAFLNYVESPVRRLAPFCSSMFLARLLFAGRIGEFFPSNWLTRFLADTVCHGKNQDGIPYICSHLIFLIAGYDKANMNSVSWFFSLSLLF